MEVEFEGGYAVGNRTRGRMKSERIHNKYSLMKYKNDPSNPIIIDIDVDASDSIRITPIPTIAKAGVLTQRSKSKPVSTVKPIQKEVSKQGQHSGHSVSVEVLHKNRSKQKFDLHSNSHSPVHGYTKSDIRKMLFTCKEKQQPSHDESDFKDPNPVISQNKRKSPPLVTAKVVQHQEKIKLEQMWPALKQLRQKLKSRNWRTENQRREFMWKEYLSSIGFGPLLNIKVDGSASRIGYYAVNNFDPERMVLNVERVTIDRGRPAICFWDVETMRLREEYEIRNGGIGSGELQDPYIPQDDNAENVNSTNGLVEEYLSTIESMFNKLVEDNHLLDSKLVEAIERHPLVCDFYEWKAKIRIFLNEASTKYGGGSSTDAGNIGPLSQWWSDNAEQINRSCQMAEHSVKSFHNSPFPNWSIGMTQEFVDIISNSPLKDIMKTPKDHCPSPLPLSIVPIHSDDVAVRARELRPRNNPPVLRSPFIERAVDITKCISRSQKDLSEWVFSTQGHPSDKLFRTCAGVAAERFHMESFFPKCELFGHVLDCWSHLLNFDEDLRSNLSPRRLFATTTLTSLYLENTVLTEEDRLKIFYENLSLSIDDFDATLHDVQLLFLPVVREFHIFLVVLDFQQPAFWIIDNIKRDEDTQHTYGLLPDIIHSYMIQYLRSVHHPNAEAFSHVPRQIPNYLGQQ
ncbi:unnamed protein product [Lactuca virosa]|uniref:Ubiquitin-like protease family profile domain-containing protein n=1 Tax=Lactuca virosa TaxID=75947 RepID=A0AAU9M5W5_9ASTR|nr:unnamed protein product [Lactuca virosa]